MISEGRQVQRPAHEHRVDHIADHELDATDRQDERSAASSIPRTETSATRAGRIVATMDPMLGDEDSARRDQYRERFRENQTPTRTGNR